MTSLLVAVNDSPAAFAAADRAIDLAVRVHATLRVLSVRESAASDGVDRAEQGASPSASARAVQLAAAAAVEHVLRLAQSAGIEATGVHRSGGVAEQILEEARAVGAELIVLALVDRPGHAIPKIGSHTMRVLEFATVPVLVVPFTGLRQRS